MRALTLTQPWAGLVASGIKLVENRPRHMIKRSDVGTRFAIHASRVIDESAYPSIAEIAPDVLPDYDDPHAVPPWWFGSSRIKSAVIAVATLDSVVVDRRCGRAGMDGDGHCDRCGLVPDDADVECPPGFFDDRDGTPTSLASDQRRWFFGPVGYVLCNVIALPRRVPCRGWQGFWTLASELERAVLEQL